MYPSSHFVIFLIEQKNLIEWKEKKDIKKCLFLLPFLLKKELNGNGGGKENGMIDIHLMQEHIDQLTKYLLHTWKPKGPKDGARGRAF